MRVTLSAFTSVVEIVSGTDASSDADIDDIVTSIGGSDVVKVGTLASVEVTSTSASDVGRTLSEKLGVRVS